MSNPIVKIRDVDIVFGSNPKAALPLIDQGKTREEIQSATGQILGSAGANLDIEEGETLVFMGLSGSGKSTLLRAVNGLNRVARGDLTVRFGDKWVNPTTCSSAELRELRLTQVAMVFQQFGLLPWRSVEENVGLGLEVAGIPKEERQERVQKQLDLVGLGDWAKKKVQELSGGMQQRVGLARAFATEAPILLMDEPYSALDPLIRTRLQDELLELREKLNRTIIFVSHDLDEAIKIGTRIAIMEGGRIAQIGTPQEILNNPANQYVEDFVSHMNPLSVAMCSDAMKPASENAEGGNEVLPGESLKVAMSHLLSTGKPVYVRNGETIVGVINKDDALRVLLREG